MSMRHVSGGRRKKSKVSPKYRAKMFPKKRERQIIHNVSTRLLKGEEISVAKLAKELKCPRWQALELLKGSAEAATAQMRWESR